MKSSTLLLLLAFAANSHSQEVTSDTSIKGRTKVVTVSGSGAPPSQTGTVVVADFSGPPVGTSDAQACAGSELTPAIDTQAAWDTHFVKPHGSRLPDLTGKHDDFAWTLYYWIRSYVSMAVTYGDTKYLDRAAGSIDHMLEHESSGGGWGEAPLYNQLGTAQVAQAIMSFVHAVYKDARFDAYRAKADAYLARAERAVQLFEYRWVDHSPVLDAGFYVYANCGANGASLCTNGALLMYNQGASMTKALLLMDRVYRLKGMEPPAGYLDKADKAASYFLKFVQPVNGTYLWRYEGGRQGKGYEDINHGHIDMSFIVAAKKFNLGGLTDSDMVNLAGTLKNNIISNRGIYSDVALDVDGSGLPGASDIQARNYERVGIGYDWIDLADYDDAVLDRVIDIFNRHMSNFNNARGALAWAEILRKKSCTSLY